MAALTRYWRYFRNWFYRRRGVRSLHFVVRGKTYMAVTSITIIAGATTAVHVTVDDQNGNPLPPADIAWTGQPTGMTITADATGFLFLADGSVPAGSDAVTATYTGPGAAAPVTGVLTVVVTAGVTGLTFTSP